MKGHGAFKQKEDEIDKWNNIYEWTEIQIDRKTDETTNKQRCERTEGQINKKFNRWKHLEGINIFKL